MINLKGGSRIVFLFKKFVVKIPVIYSWYGFLNGLLSSMRELDKIKYYKGNYPEQIPKVYYGNRFGFIIIMKRYREVTREENDEFRDELTRIAESDTEGSRYFWYGDIKPENYGYDEQGRLVKFDHGL